MWLREAYVRARPSHFVIVCKGPIIFYEGSIILILTFTSKLSVAAAKKASLGKKCVVYVHLK